MSEKTQSTEARKKKQEAYSTLRAGGLPQAKKLFDQTCRLDPQDAEAWFMQGNLAGQLGQMDDAERCFRQAAKLQPHRPEAHFNLGKSLEAQGRYDQALESYRQVLRVQPDAFAAHAQVANLLQAEGRLEEALASQREAVRLAPAMAEAHYNLGNLLKETMRYGEAEAAYRQALERNPGFAEAWHNLGIVLSEQGRDADAEAAYREALGLNPGFAEAHCALGNLLHGLGRPKEAEAAYREALGHRPDYEKALHNLGTVLMDQGRFDEAAQDYQAALDLRPSASTHYNMGNLCLRRQRLDEAVGHYREALTLAPQNAEIHIHLGHALRQQGRPCEAEAAYRQALAIDPAHVNAHISLATILTEAGRLDEARLSYDRALELEPGLPRAITGKASILEKQGDFEQAYRLVEPLLQAGEVNVNAALIFAALCRPLKRCDEAVALMERLLEDERPALGIYDRILVHFTLGRLLDAAGEYERAFSHYQKGNRLADRRFDVQAHNRHIEALMAAYNAAFMARAPRATQHSRRPVFIVGMSRSGTTLVEQILAAHPAVFGAGELEEMRQIVMDLPATLGTEAPYPQCVGSLTAEHADLLARRYLSRIDSFAPADAVRVTDKMPSNFLHLGLIALLFPEARIIHCVRDPLDTCLSCYFQHFAEGHPYTYDLAHVGAFYRQYQRLMDHWRKVLTVPMLEVRYEELVADQEGVSRDMVEFCGLEWDARCLRFHEIRRPVATASNDQVRQPLYTRSAGRWRHYDTHLGPLRKALGKPGGYEPAPRPSNPDGPAATSVQASKDQAYASLQSGDLEKAKRLYAQACRLDPQDAEACYNLGTVAKDLGAYDEAEAAYRQALRLKPNAVAALHNMGTVLAELGRLDEAAQYYEAAIRQTPNALSHSNLGNIYTRQQRLEEAIGHYRDALQLEPGAAEVYNNLGTALCHLGRYPEAEVVFRDALRLRPDFASAYANLGGVLLYFRRLDEAQACYRRALEIEPDLRRAVTGTANVLEKRGEFEQAYERLRPFLAAGEADIDMALVLAEACRPLKRCEEAVDLLERVLAETDETPDAYARISAHFALGRLLDAAGEYDRAFSHFRQGNALVRPRFDARAHERHIDALINVFSADFMTRAPRAARLSQRPIFIIGMPRSGTTLAEQILASHPAIHGAGELYDIGRIVAALPETTHSQRPYPECLDALTAAHCDQLAGRYLGHLETLAPADAVRVTDKMPDNFQHLGLIALLFPQARVIHCLRDPLDTCLSCYFQSFAENHPYAYDLEQLGHYYRLYRRLMAHWRDVLDVPTMELHYADVVADQEGTSRAMIEFCGLEWDERCLRFHESGRVVTTASYNQVRQPLYSRSLERWRHYERYLGPLRQALGE